MKYHPVFLDLTDRPVLIVGGGAVAVEKLRSLLPSGARITVVAPEACDEVRRWHDEGCLDWRQRSFDEADVEPAFMVIAATDDPVLNARVFEAGNRRLRLTNSVDDPQHCNFIMAAIAASGPMQVAVSSSGCSPVLAQRARSRIAEEILTTEVGELAEFLGEWRPAVKAALNGYRQRQGFWEKVVDSEIPAILAREGKEAAHREMLRALRWAGDHEECLTCGCGGGWLGCDREAA